MNNNITVNATTTCARSEIKSMSKSVTVVDSQAEQITVLLLKNTELSTDKAMWKQRAERAEAELAALKDKLGIDEDD